MRPTASFWHGAKDPVVPYQHAYRFYEGVKAGYDKADEKIDFILDLRLGIRSAEKECLRQRTGSRNIYCLLCKMLKYSLKICYDAYTDIMMKVTN